MSCKYFETLIFRDLSFGEKKISPRNNDSIIVNVI